MIKIGILTYHRSYNYGAFMQSYSLANKLTTLYPNCKIEVIDYCSKEVYLQYNKSLPNLVKLVISTKSFRRKLTYLRMLYTYLTDHTSLSSVESKKFEEIINELPLSHEKIISDRLGDIATYINDNYDIVISGSDAVFNWQIRKFPNPYLLGASIKPIKLTYAASSYGQPYKEITYNEKEYLFTAWNNIAYLGVRDIPTEKFVEYVLGKRKAKHNCDPTVFLDMNSFSVNKELLMEKLKKGGFDPDKKTIGVMAHKWLSKIVKENIDNSYQIVSVFNYNEEADVNILDLNPFEWVILFSYFNITITHYFHGNLLSLKNGTPTICIEQRSSYNQTYNSKIRDFMYRINMMDKCFYVDEITRDSSNLMSVINSIESDGQIKEKISDGINKESLSFEDFNIKLSQIINRLCTSSQD